MSKMSSVSVMAKSSRVTSLACSVTKSIAAQKRFVKQGSRYYWGDDLLDHRNWCDHGCRVDIQARLMRDGNWGNLSNWS